MRDTSLRAQLEELFAADSPASVVETAMPPQDSKTTAIAARPPRSQFIALARALAGQTPLESPYEQWRNCTPADKHGQSFVVPDLRARPDTTFPFDWGLVFDPFDVQTRTPIIKDLPPPRVPPTVDKHGNPIFDGCWPDGRRISPGLKVSN